MQTRLLLHKVIIPIVTLSPSLINIKAGEPFILTISLSSFILVLTILLICFHLFLFLFLLSMSWFLYCVSNTIHIVFIALIYFILFSLNGEQFGSTVIVLNVLNK